MKIILQNFKEVPYFYCAVLRKIFPKDLLIEKYQSPNQKPPQSNFSKFGFKN